MFKHVTRQIESWEWYIERLSTKPRMFCYGYISHWSALMWNTVHQCRHIVTRKKQTSYWLKECSSDLQGWFLGLLYCHMVKNWNIWDFGEFGTTTTPTIVVRPFVSDYPGEPVPEETLTHPTSRSSSKLYQLLLSTTIHSILPVQIACLAIFSTTSLHVCFGLPLGLEPSTS